MLDSKFLPQYSPPPARVTDADPDRIHRQSGPRGSSRLFYGRQRPYASSASSVRCGSWVDLVFCAVSPGDKICVWMYVNFFGFFSNVVYIYVSFMLSISFICLSLFGDGGLCRIGYSASVLEVLS